MHKSITVERVLAIHKENECGLGNEGICAACGQTTGGCEVDCCRVWCEGCGKFSVYGSLVWLCVLEKLENVAAMVEVIEKGAPNE